ncbi:MAG: hypothetical protein ACRCWJ_18635 [Casimicrobium sp.]
MNSELLAQTSPIEQAGEPTRLERLEVSAKSVDGVFTYAKAYTLLTDFATLPSTSKIDLALYLRPRESVNLKHSDVKLNVQGETIVSAVEIRNDWRLRIPINRIAFEERADFVMNQDVGKFQREARIEVRNPSTASVSLGYYFEALREVTAAERKLFFRWVPPKTAIVFVFVDAQRPSVEVACEGQRIELFESNGKTNSIAISFDPSWQRRECVATFSPKLPTYSIPVHGG